MSWTFNPPPGWPVPAGDWLPPAGWEPDPDWPPAPPGWEFWIHTPEPASQAASAPAPPAGAHPAGPYPVRARRSRGRLWVGAAIAGAVLLVCTGGTVSSTWDRTPPRADDPAPGSAPPGWEECPHQPSTCNTGATVPGGVLVWGAPADVPGWNLFAASDTTLAQILSGVLPTAGWFLPDGTWQWNLDLLAEEPVRVSANTYQYRIRPDARWSDGTGITADDFSFAWRHNARDNDLCDECPSVRPGYDRIRAVSGSDLGRTVMVSFRGEGYPEWFTLFTGIYPAHLAERAGFDLDTPEGMKEASTWFDSTPPDWSGGPWRVTEVHPGTSVTLEPNPEWYGPQGPRLDFVAFRFLPGPTVMGQALDNGEIHGFGPLLDPDPGEVVQRPDLLNQVGSSVVWDHLDFNLRREWTTDIELRRAIFTAIDLRQVLSVAYPVPAGGFEPRRNHLFPPTSPHYQDLVSNSGQGSGDLATALAILDRAGYEIRAGRLTRDGRRIDPLILEYPAGNPRRAAVAEQIAAQLEGIGVPVEPRPNDFATIQEERDYDLVLFGWETGPDFAADGYTFWHSRSDRNLGGYRDDDVDALVEQARYAHDQDLAAQLLTEAMRYLVDDAYVLPIAATPEQLVVRDIFRNIRPNPYHTAGPFYHSHTWGIAASG